MDSKERQHELIYDLCVVGGGINGAGIARDATLRGLSVLLLEAQDLAEATSSSSTKIIHGGLRYLEHYEFRLVREALAERETLMSLAPHIIYPLTFTLPHDKRMRPAWMIKIGLFLYDHLAKRDILPGSTSVKFEPKDPLQSHYRKGFTYSDCWVDDARLVVLNAIDAKKNGANIHTHMACTKITEREGVYWDIDAEDSKGKTHSFKARNVVNATGPWVRGFIDQSGLAKPKTPNVRLVKGSHIITPKIYEGDQAYMLQQPDKRIVFAIPYEHNYTLIGTTDTEFKDQAPETAALDETETDYLITAVNTAFKKQVTAKDIVWSYSGVRPLLDDGDDDASSVTRDYRLIMDEYGQAKLLSVFGGKITTYRCLAKDAVDKILGDDAKKRFSITHEHKLPGGDIPGGDIKSYIARQSEIYPWADQQTLHRYATSYGTMMDGILKGKDSLEDMGIHYGDDVFEAEIVHLIKNEWAKSLDDILWRRSKLGLHVSEATVAHIKNHLSVLIKD